MIRLVVYHNIIEPNVQHSRTYHNPSLPQCLCTIFQTKKPLSLHTCEHIQEQTKLSSFTASPTCLCTIFQIKNPLSLHTCENIQEHTKLSSFTASPTCLCTIFQIKNPLSLHTCENIQEQTKLSSFTASPTCLCTIFQNRPKSVPSLPPCLRYSRTDPIPGLHHP